LRAYIANAGRNKKISFLLSMVFFSVLIISFIHTNELLNYDNSNFSLTDRLFTQPAIMVNYMYRLSLPFTMDIGLYFDDIKILTTFWNIKTIASVTLLAFLGLMACYLLLKHNYRYLSFGILFFLAGHSLESTIFPLEMYYYHRNYLPSIGFYFFLLVFLYEGFSYIGRPRLLVIFAGLYLSLFFLFSNGISKAWSTREKVILNSYHYHPQSVRVNMSLVEMFRAKGRLDQALVVNEEFIKMKSEDSFRLVIQRVFLYCSANLPMPEHEYFRFSGSIDRHHVLEVANALTNLHNIFKSRNCVELNFQRLIESLSEWTDDKLESREYSREQVWHLDYFIIEFLLSVEQQESAFQRLKRYQGLENIYLFDELRHRLESGGQGPQ
jgi:protein O-mannosyl-transferase